MMETKRLVLRHWEDADAEALFRYASHPDVGPIAGWPPHTSVEDSLEIIRTVFAAPEVYAVVLKDTGEPVGCCGLIFPDGLHPSHMRQGEAEVGYWIGRPYWGQGLIPEAIATLLARCFGELRLDAVWCVHYDGNTNSRRVIEKSGFRFHHTNHGVASPLGDRRAEHFYVMTKEDYRAAENKAQHQDGKAMTVHQITFSPTGGTRRVCEYVCESIDEKSLVTDLCAREG